MTAINFVVMVFFIVGQRDGLILYSIMTVYARLPGRMVNGGSVHKVIT